MGGAQQRPGSLDEAQQREIVQHGAGMTSFSVDALLSFSSPALGLGVAALASESDEVFEELMNLLYHHDSAIAGEAAGYLPLPLVARRSDELVCHWDWLC